MLTQKSPNPAASRSLPSLVARRLRVPSLFVATLLLITTLLTACVTIPSQIGTRDVVTLEMEFSDFAQIEVSDAFNVQIRHGDEYRVTIEIDEASRDDLEINQRGDTVEIGMRPRGVSFFWIFNVTRRAEITLPNLVGLAAHDASHVHVSGFHTETDAHFEITDASSLRGEIDTGDTRFVVTDASNIDLAGVRHNVEVTVSDASTVRLVGEGRNATIRASDASTVNLADFPLQDATIHAEDASKITVDVAGRLDAEAEDASHIVYYGDPTFGNTHTNDASSINAGSR